MSPSTAPVAAAEPDFDMLVVDLATRLIEDGVEPEQAYVTAESQLRASAGSDLAWAAELENPGMKPAA
ncbi:MAG: hypothetical protein K1X79_01940 [Oligoflexia bacterium]|nr:hypothetical protein [Oligoflexia bacterium]